MDYLAHAFHSVLPWATCGNEWNTHRSVDRETLGLRHALEPHSALITLCEGNIPVTSLHKGLILSLLLAIEKTVEFCEISDAMTLMDVTVVQKRLLH